MGLKAKILAVKDRRPVMEPCPEWGFDLYIKPLSGTDRERYFDQIVQRTKGEALVQEGLRGWVLVRSLCDEDGALIFDATEEDATALMERDPGVLERLFDRALEISKLTPAAIEATEKNSASTPSEP